MKLVVDASVALKWFFQERDDEPDVEPALALLSALDASEVTMLQPPQFSSRGGGRACSRKTGIRAG